VASAEELEQLRSEILDKVRRYFEAAGLGKPRQFIPGKTFIQYSGPVFDGKEYVNAVDTLLKQNICMGAYGEAFEKLVRSFFKSRDFVMVNSGSAANLVAMGTLCAPTVRDHLKPGDEVLTPAVTFPTTLAPILLYNLTPVLVDCELGTYNVDPKLLEAAVSHRTRAIFVPHTLGNPNDMDTVMALVKKHNLFLIEDCCDALGSTWDGQLVGTFGHLATLSMYPAHHITVGEGGGVIVNAGYGKIVRSLRDWGRDCWCAPGKADTCGRRFQWQLGKLPKGYDHKYIYSNIGYNLKPTDAQGAMGVAQFEKLPFIFQARRRNFARLYEGLSDLEEHLLLPKWYPKADSCWFGFPITVREGVSRNKVIAFLQESKIDTRLIFGGNILRQPGFLNIPRRVYGDLENSDVVMERSFFIGVYPRITDDMIDYVVDRFHHLFSGRGPSFSEAGQAN